MVIKIDTGRAERQLLKGFSELSQKKVNLAITRSINSALHKTSTAAARAVTSRYNLSYADVSTRLRVVESSPATASSMMRGYLKAYNQPFSLAHFKPRMINDGEATKIKKSYQMHGKKKVAQFAQSESKRAKFLRADKQKITNGVIVQVMKGKDKVLRSAFISMRSRSGGRTNASVSGRGQYNQGFKFTDDGASKSLRGVGIASVLRSNNINPILKEYAENEYLRILYKELQKRINGIGEQHSKHL